MTTHEKTASQPLDILERHYKNVCHSVTYLISEKRHGPTYWEEFSGAMRAELCAYNYYRYAIVGRLRTAVLVAEM